MAVGGMAVETPGVDGRITLSVVITCIVAASSGLIFGYDIGISGGVTTMPPFLEKFFPKILRKMMSADINIYCVYDSQVLTLFTSSLYLAGLASSLVASRVTAAFGRRSTMILGGFTFLVGGALNAGSENIAMLILGRIFLGIGVGFTNQATPVYLSEVAPAKWRGAFNAGFQFFLSLGVVAAGCINFATSKRTWGWRLSLGLAIVPAAVMALGAFFISDSPSSLVERNKIDQARKALLRVRGSDTDVEPELQELVKWSEASKVIKQEPFLSILQRQYRPHLVMAIAIPFFQQLTGINIVAFYAPNLFQSVGFGNDAALLSAIILGVVNLVSVLVSTAIVDRFGRRVLFIAGGIQMFLFQIAVAIVLAKTTGTHGAEELSKGSAILVLVFLCLYAIGFGWSWGPLTWLIPSEIFPLRIRTTGQSISIAINFLTVFILSQTFLTMLCHFKFGVFLFYGGWIFVMTVFIIFFLPETKGIPLDSMYTVWENHWYWRRFVPASESKPTP
ncbi:sugar transport protein 5-like [Prosopis cineraria]|uniref:sugar transport protein 5-like n=1 Tax=Prosopis cineraria TaxID=364024 RepID=UPI002410A024|nr:sugar transport protein 5-like [Prosopis cineraria]